MTAQGVDDDTGAVWSLLDEVDHWTAVGDTGGHSKGRATAFKKHLVPLEVAGCLCVACVHVFVYVLCVLP